MRYDVVIVGAGPSGLAAAARLAHFGVKTCLVESHRRLGGLSSWHHVKDREISSGLHALTNYQPSGRGGPLGRLLRQLRLKYDDLQLRPQGFSAIRFPSATLRFTNDPESIRQEVAATFPGQIDAFDRFRQLVRDTDEGELTLRQSSARHILGQYITNPLLADMLMCPVMYYGNPGGVGDGADRDGDGGDMDWLLFCVVWKCIFESGFAYPAHGMRPLWETLARRIREDGGDIRLNARVERFLVEDGRVRAAVLAGGEAIEGNLFFSSAGGVETDDMLGAAAGRAKPVGGVSIVEGISLLDGSASGAGMEETVIFYSFHDSLVFRRPDGLVEAGSGVVCAPGNYLPRASAEEHIKISQLASYPVWRKLTSSAYGIAKREAAAVMAASLGRLGIVPAKVRSAGASSGLGIFDDLFTPLTLERFTGHREGALYGSPVKSRTGETSCRNLFLIGADQGFHGIVGAMLSGVAMANLHCLASRNG